MRCSLLLAAASLSISPPVVACSPHKAAQAGIGHMRSVPQLKQKGFPPRLYLEGKQFDRLTGPTLAGAISGKKICLGRCSHIAGNVHVFHQDGRYVQPEDRWEGYGTYKIIKNVVMVDLEGHMTKGAFYRSREGSLARAVVNQRGEIVAGEVVVENLPPKKVGS